MNDRQMHSKEKKKLQIQEVQSNTIHELKVDSVVMENTCSGKENGNSETASSKTIKEISLDSATKDVHKQLDKDEFQEEKSMAAFWVVNRQFQKYIDSLFSLDYDSPMTEEYFAKYTGIKVKQFRDELSNTWRMLRSLLLKEHVIKA
ncbi:hypothetical protein Tco_0128979 [Tanacetum coccineum]